MVRKWDTGDDERDKTGSTEKTEETSLKLDELLKRAEPMISQCNNLYNMFAAGVERLPPLEIRKNLENIMLMLQNMQKPNATYQFRVTTLNTRFVTMRDRWDKLLRDLESGKIRRYAGPKRNK